MELEVNEIKALEPIKFNYEDIKKWVIEKTSEYKKMTYTEETITLAKADRATLNKVSKAINDQKIKVKNKLLEPYTDFENKCKELMSIICDASSCIDSQIKLFENMEDQKKKEEILTYFNEKIKNYKDLIVFEKIFNNQWLNKTYSIKKVKEDIDHIIAKTNTDLGVIDTQFTEDSINKQVKSEYFENIDNASVLTIAILKGNTIIENNKKLEELKQKETIVNAIPDISKKEILEHKGEFAEQVRVLDFRVWVTDGEMMKLKNFLITNGIKYGKVD